MLSRKQKSTVCDVTSILHFGGWERGRQKGRFKQVWHLRNGKASQANLTITMILAVKPGWGEESVPCDANSDFAVVTFGTISKLKINNYFSYGYP